VNLVLASGSPRRAELLTRLGLRFEVLPADLDETRRPDESPGVYVERLAREKAQAVGGPEDVVVAADTAVVSAGLILGKPAHPAEARSMLLRLQGEKHDVFTGIAVRRGEEIASAVDVTEVEMLPMTDDEVEAYVDTGEPMDKAGSYALQGRGGLFVSTVTGSPFTIIGLPVHLLPRLIRAVGVDPEVVLAPV
jgi:septum formation protein